MFSPGVNPSYWKCLLSLMHRNEALGASFPVIVSWWRKSIHARGFLVIVPFGEMAEVVSTELAPLVGVLGNRPFIEALWCCVACPDILPLTTHLRLLVCTHAQAQLGLTSSSGLLLHSLVGLNKRRPPFLNESFFFSFFFLRITSHAVIY